MREIMTNKVTINLNMLCTFIKDIVVSDLNSTIIITINQSGSKNKDSIQGVGDENIHVYEVTDENQSPPQKPMTTKVVITELQIHHLKYTKPPLPINYRSRTFRILRVLYVIYSLNLHPPLPLKGPNYVTSSFHSPIK